MVLSLEKEKERLVEKERDEIQLQFTSPPSLREQMG
jgi:hypothetical protein